MVISDLKLRYGSSFLGYLWTLIRPLAIFSILYLVFGKFMKFGGEIPYFSVYLLLGLVFWSLFAELTTQVLSSIVERGALLRKVSFPRYIVVFSVGSSAIISFFLNMVVIAIFMIAVQVPLRIDALWLIPLFLQLAVLALAAGLLLSALYVRLRDIDYIWQVFLQAAFYGTPILYPVSMIPGIWARVLLLNPIAQIIQDARHALITEQSQTITDVWGTDWIRAVPLGITLLLVGFSVAFFRQRSRTFAEEA